MPEVVEAVGGRIPVFVDGGVERVRDILQRELRIVMTQMGAAKVADISLTSLQRL